MPSIPDFALSLKQPWAALVVHGIKSIEVRRWATARRGHILIHAARVPDSRPEAWRHVPDQVQDSARLTGGIIGSAELTGCITYHTLDEFVRDRDLHLNEAAWFEPPQLFGFAFAQPALLPFHAYPGWFRFFKVKDDPRAP